MHSNLDGIGIGMHSKGSKPELELECIPSLPGWNWNWNHSTEKPECTQDWNSKALIISGSKSTSAHQNSARNHQKV